MSVGPLLRFSPGESIAAHPNLENEILVASAERFGDAATHKVVVEVNALGGRAARPQRRARARAGRAATRGRAHLNAHLAALAAQRERRRISRFSAERE